MQNRTIAPTDYNSALRAVESEATQHSDPSKMDSVASTVSDKVSSAGRAAADYVGEKIGSAAGGIHAAATTIKDEVSHSRGGEAISGLAHDAASRLGATADYLRDSNANQMMDDLKTLVKNNPGKSLLGALLVGFVVGRNLRSNE
jgi:hypothetical protein